MKAHTFIATVSQSDLIIILEAARLALADTGYLDVMDLADEDAAALKKRIEEFTSEEIATAQENLVEPGEPTGVKYYRLTDTQADIVQQALTCLTDNTWSIDTETLRKEFKSLAWDTNSSQAPKTPKRIAEDCRL